jgi:hypothetical protein
VKTSDRLGLNGLQGQIHVMDSKQINRYPKFSIQIAFCLVLVFSSTGCLSIRRIPISTTISQSRVVFPSNAEHECGADTCTLYDRSEVAHQWAARLNPVHLVPTQVIVWGGAGKARMSNWFENRKAEHAARKANMNDWLVRKKEEANPAPWPRFHPVPTKPVFEPDDKSPSIEPDLYGRFGSN